MNGKVFGNFDTGIHIYIYHYICVCDTLSIEGSICLFDSIVSCSTWNMLEKGRNIK